MLEAPYTVPSLPIHHDVHQPVPSAAYLSAIREALDGIMGLAPQVFHGLSWFFDQTEILRPCFRRAYRDGDDAFLYLLRLDLAMRPGEGTVLERGTSDAKPRWASRKLFVEPAPVPLAGTQDAGGERAFAVKQTISDTYLGEVGPAFAGSYDREGVWMDPRLTRFFSWLLLPSGPVPSPVLPAPMPIRHRVRDAARAVRCGLPRGDPLGRAVRSTSSHPRCPASSRPSARASSRRSWRSSRS